MKAASPPRRCASAIMCSVTVVFPEDSGPYTSIIRPRGSPPTPSATSSGRIPVGMTSTFIFAVASPRRMIEPLPKSFSICFSAFSNASFLSIWHSPYRGVSSHQYPYSSAFFRPCIEAVALTNNAIFLPPFRVKRAARLRRLCPLPKQPVPQPLDIIGEAPCIHMVPAAKDRIIDRRALPFHRFDVRLNLTRGSLAVPEGIVPRHLGAKRLPARRRRVHPGKRFRIACTDNDPEVLSFSAAIAIFFIARASLFSPIIAVLCLIMSDNCPHGHTSRGRAKVSRTIFWRNQFSLSRWDADQGKRVSLSFRRRSRCALLFLNLVRRVEICNIYSSWMPVKAKGHEVHMANLVLHVRLQTQERIGSHV